MIVKTYQANSMQEAIKKIKDDLGDDAVIISARKIKKGSFFSFFRRDILEITAALDKKKDQTFEGFLDNAGDNNVNISKEDKIELRLKKLESMIATLGEKNIYSVFNNIRSDISDLKTTLIYVKESDIDITKLPIGINRYFKYMCEIGINKIYAFRIANAISKNIKNINVNDSEHMIDYFSAVISQFFKVGMPQKKIIVVVGPTGVGKTTTIAKLSAMYKLKMHKNIGIVTTDTYRIGAVDQLMTYAKIMEIPINVSISKSDLKNALKDFSHLDNIFIDTVGRSQKNIEQLNEIFTLFSDETDISIAFVASLNTKEGDLLETFKIFSKLPIGGIIFTKLDETNTPGTMLNMSVKARKPVFFVSFGQSVPDDIMVADPLKLASLIMHKEY